MKKSLFIILWLLLFNLQSQVVFCPLGSHWSTVFNTGSFPQSTAYDFQVDVNCYNISVSGIDTVKTLTSDRFFLDGGYANPSDIYIKQKGDTIFMKTYFTNDQWQVLFNYGAQIGEKWYNRLYTAPYLDSSMTLSYTSTVLSKQTVTINGFPLKQLNIKQLNNNFGNNYIVYTLTERLGSDKFVFTFAGTEVTDGEFFNAHLCYYDSTFGYYYYGGNTCVLTTGLEKHTTTSSVFLIYPNPVTKNISLKINDVNPKSNDMYRYIIYNTLGEKLMGDEISIYGNENEINVSSLPDGVYTLSLLNLKEKNNRSQNLRFVKRN